ncbi:MAG: hypothetical protein Q8M47_06730 [Devosia sp.]|jgi:hypothetical protein|nr:hypothetical protein [Devosia sp.]
MASFGMGFVHAMLIDITDGSDRGSTWDRERRLADSLIDTTTRLDDSFEPPADDTEPPPPPPPTPPGGLGAAMSNALAMLNRALPAR